MIWKEHLSSCYSQEPNENLHEDALQIFTSNSFSHIDFLKIHHSSARNPMRGGHIRVTSPPCLHCVYRSKPSERMNAKHYLSLAENDSGGLKESTVPMRFMLTSLSWFALEARNVTRAENCDDLCLSVKGCPTRFCQIPMALRMPRTYTIWNIKVTSPPRLHCVYRSKRSERMNAKHCLSLAENDSGGLKESTVPMRFMFTSLSWFVLEATNVTRAENCDDLCLSVEGCCQIPMALRMPRTHTIWNIKVTAPSRLHCVCRSKRSAWMRNIAFPLRRTIQEGLKKVQFLCGLCLLLFHDLR